MLMLIPKWGKRRLPSNVQYEPSGPSSFQRESRALITNQPSPSTTRPFLVIREAASGTAAVSPPRQRTASSDREVAELDRELERRTLELAPALFELRRCGAITAATLLAEIDRSAASRTTPSSPVTAASPHSKRAQAGCKDTDSTAAATASSTRRSTASGSRKHGSTPPPAPTS